MIQYRARIRPNDAERVADALMLTREADPPETTRERNYWEFLRSIARDCGDEIVGLCALGLGRSAIGNMKGCFRLELSRRIRNNRVDLNCPVLRDSLQANSANRASRDTNPPEYYLTRLGHSGAPSHAPVEHNQRMRMGDVYMLFMDDVRAIVNSDHATGIVRLYVSDDVDFEPWVTVPIPRELSAQLVMNRPRLM
jgi:hypothetical protein